jgi:hypothetical protein
LELILQAEESALDRITRRSTADYVSRKMARIAQLDILYDKINGQEE